MSVTWWNSKRVFTQSGQTIVEVLLATAVVAMVLTTVAAGLTYSVKNTAEARYRAFATTFAQDAIEVYRSERAILGWETFRDALNDGTYCLNTLPTTSAQFIALAAGGCSGGVAMMGMQFEREVDVLFLSADQIEVSARVNWTDGTRTPEVRVVQQFSPY